MPNTACPVCGEIFELSFEKKATLALEEKQSYLSVVHDHNDDPPRWKGIVYSKGERRDRTVENTAAEQRRSVRLAKNRKNPYK